MNFIFLPGFLCDERVWENQARELATSHATQILDLRLCRNLDEMMAQISREAPRKFHLLGFSMGGYVAQAFAHFHPDRLESLTLVAISAGKLSEKEIASRLKMESVLKVAHYRGLSPKEMPRYIHEKHLQNPEVVDVIIEMSKTNTSEMYLNQMRATLYREDYRNSLQSAKYPIMVVAGAQDRVVPCEELKTFAAGLPRAEFHIIEETGHYIPLEQPLALNKLINTFIRA